MPVLRRIARPMLATMFVLGGIETLRDPDPRVKKAEPVVRRIADLLPEGAPKDVANLVRLDAGVKVGAGLMLSFGKAPRVAAALLAGSVLPTTVAGHPYWQYDDPSQRSNQRIHFFKNLSMLGGLLIAAADTGGSPSLGWRARRAKRLGSRRVHGAAHSASGLAHSASGRAHDAAGAVRDAIPVG